MNTDQKTIFKYAGWLGLGLLVAGYLHYEVTTVMTTLDKGLLIAGAILIMLSLAMNFGAVMAFFSRRSSKLGANTAFLTVAVLAIIGVLNFLGYRHHKRFDLTSEQLYSLSDQTRKTVSGLTKEVKIIKFDKADDGLKDQMAEYKSLSGKLSYERIDPVENPQIAKQYEVKNVGDLVIASGDRKEHLTSPSTEQDITNAILKVTREKLKNVCFIEDHGERPLAGSGAEGLSGADKELKNQNYTTKTVSLLSGGAATDLKVTTTTTTAPTATAAPATAGDVPNDCDVLVIAGPKKAFFPAEIQSVKKYLDNGGKVMTLIDPETDPQLSELLKEWNVTMGNDLVLDVSGVGRIFGIGPAAPIARGDASHPITRDAGQQMTVLPMVRSVKSGAESKPDVSATEILKTSPQSWAETDIKNPQAEFKEGADTKGPISLGVAASKKVGEKEARFVVIGDSDFATNAYFAAQQLANRDLFLNSVNWLAQDEDLISIRPKSPTNRAITLTETQKNLIWLLTVIFLPALVIVSGGYIWWKRR